MEIYSSHMPKSRGGGHNDVGYEDTGRFTRCVTTQIAGELECGAAPRNPASSSSSSTCAATAVPGCCARAAALQAVLPSPSMCSSPTPTLLPRATHPPAVTTYYCGSEAAKSGEDHTRDSHTSSELVELLEELTLPLEEVYCLLPWKFTVRLAAQERMAQTYAGALLQEGWVTLGLGGVGVGGNGGGWCCCCCGRGRGARGCAGIQARWASHGCTHCCPALLKGGRSLFEGGRRDGEEEIPFGRLLSFCPSPAGC